MLRKLRRGRQCLKMHDVICIWGVKENTCPSVRLPTHSQSYGESRVAGISIDTNPKLT